MPGNIKSIRPVIITSFALGMLVEIAALLAAIASGGAGHGDYVAARALFPVPMLLTLLQDDRIGPLSMAVGLLQFPIYGGLLGWSVARSNYLAIALVAFAHVLAAVVCFSGAVPNFS